ncbi:hypothetical protein DITRI_Ditri09bG0113300 [Diplodiscus trichospermus]
MMITEAAREREVVGASRVQSSYSYDWRDNLFTIFMDRLSRRLSKRPLWEAFNDYCRVVDTFVLYKDKGRRKSITFTFVRSRHDFEMRRVIETENNRRIDGWNIIVKIVDYGWKERLPRKDRRVTGKEVQGSTRQVWSTKGQVNRSYKEVFTGLVAQEVEEGGTSRTSLKEHFESYK